MKMSSHKRKHIVLTDSIALSCGRVHEITGQSCDSFALLIAAKLSGPIMWIGRSRDIGSLTPSALQDYIDPCRVVLTEARSRQEILWASEQALRSSGVSVVITQMSVGPDLKESRRLQLAAEQGGTLGLVLIGKSAQSSAAQTRWECRPYSANSQTWLWEVTKNKSGPVGCFQATWLPKKQGDNDAAGNVHLVSATAA